MPGSPESRMARSSNWPRGRILYFFVQIGSHASRTPLSITNFGPCHAPLGPLSNLQAITGPQTAQKVQKRQIFGSNVEIFEVSRKDSAAVEMSIGKRVTRHTPCRFERKSTVTSVRISASSGRSVKPPPDKTVSNFDRAVHLVCCLPRGSDRSKSLLHNCGV
jgi:hypothetical protein